MMDSGGIPTPPSLPGLGGAKLPGLGGMPGLGGNPFKGFPGLGKKK
jgi:signal recognition particle subunit SRP54